MVLFRIFSSIFIISLLGLAIFGKRGLTDWEKVAKRNEEVLIKIEALEKQKQELNRQINILKKDAHYEEMTIRKLLGYIKKNEIIIRF